MIPQHPWIKEFTKSPRQGVLLAFIGVNGTGKSTLMKSFFKVNKRNLILPANMLDASETWGRFPVIKPAFKHEIDQFSTVKNKKNLVFYLPNVKKFQGIRIVNVGEFRTGEHKREFFETIGDVDRLDTAYTDGALFIDDARNYIISKGQLPNRTIKLLTGRRHMMLDIFLAYHSFNDINRDLIQYKCKFFLFRTDLPPSDAVMEKIALKEDMMEAIAYINKRSKKDPHYCEPFDPVDSDANAFVRKHYRK